MINRDFLRPVKKITIPFCLILAILYPLYYINVFRLASEMITVYYNLDIPEELLTGLVSRVKLCGELLIAIGFAGFLMVTTFYFLYHAFNKRKLIGFSAFFFIIGSLLLFSSGVHLSSNAYVLIEAHREARIIAQTDYSEAMLILRTGAYNAVGKGLELLIWGIFALIISFILIGYFMLDNDESFYGSVGPVFCIIGLLGGIAFMNPVLVPLVPIGFLFVGIGITKIADFWLKHEMPKSRSKSFFLRRKSKS